MTFFLFWLWKDADLEADAVAGWVAVGIQLGGAGGGSEEAEEDLQEPGKRAQTRTTPPLQDIRKVVQTQDCTGCASLLSTDPRL